MKGFVISVIMLAFVIVGIVGVTGYYQIKIGEIYDDVNKADSPADMAAAFDKYESCRIYISLCSPDTLTHEVERAFSECLSEGGSFTKKSRLLLAIRELRRQVGFSIESII